MSDRGTPAVEGPQALVRELGPVDAAMIVVVVEAIPFCVNVALYGPASPVRCARRSFLILTARSRPLIGTRW